MTRTGSKSTAAAINERTPSIPVGAAPTASLRMTSPQRAALAHVYQKALKLEADSSAELAALLSRSSCTYEHFARALAHITREARVVVHFHPDRLTDAGLTVAESLRQTGAYQNQFESGLSNGSLTAFRGGQRDLWEARMFGGAYQQEAVQAQDRPRYGALDLSHFADGPAPRFGSCYFRLKPMVLQRCTFTDTDSVFEPTAFGTLQVFTPVLYSLLRSVEIKGGISGIYHTTVGDFLDRLSQLHAKPVQGSRHFGRTLDDYVEAQVHGPISLSQDVERLVIDPSFQGTRVGETLTLLCQENDIHLDWHGGFRVRGNTLPDEFRGPIVARLGRTLVGDGWLDPAILGEAAAEFKRHPEQWASFGTPPEVLQYFKQLWHCLVQFGEGD